MQIDVYFTFLYHAAASEGWALGGLASLLWVMFGEGLYLQENNFRFEIVCFGAF